MRINQFIAVSSGLSRRAADAAITAGRVAINRQVAHLGQAIDPNTDTITLDDRDLRLPTQFTYIMLHKPIGYVSSRKQQGSDPTLYALLPTQYHHLRLVGRLDRDSSGLILLTDDGTFIQRYAHPSYDKVKTYHLTLSRSFTAADQQHLAKGVQLEDGPSHPSLRSVSGPHLQVSLTEGRNRQLRRTFGALGYDVVRLHRSQVGPYQLDDLPSGQWRIFKPI